jgi:hypothetical protein
MSEIKKSFTSRFGSDGVIMEADFCLASSTRVLTHDFNYVPIDTVVAGEYLVGFDENLQKYGGTKFRKSLVESVKQVQKPCLRLSYDDGTFVECSTEHQWVARKRKEGYSNRWFEAKNLQVGFVQPQVVEVWEDKSKSPDGAWMSGFLDGEGWISHASTFGVGQNVDKAHQCIWDKCLPILRDSFDSLSYSPNKRSKVCRVSPNGLRTAWTCVGLYHPVRLQKKLQETYEGTAIRSKRNRVKTIVKIENIGEQTVIAVQTSTRTYIAEGMLSHNCQLEVVGQAFLSGDEQMKQDIRDGVDFHCSRLAAKLGEKYEKVYKACHIHNIPKYIKMRKDIKTFSFQRAYGAGVNAIMESTGMSRSEVEELIAIEEEMYPEVSKYYESVSAEVSRSRRPTSGRTEQGFPQGKGVFKSITGREYWFKEYDSFRRDKDVDFSMPQLKNYPVQGFSTADIVPLVLGKLYRRLKSNVHLNGKVFLINTVHDSIILDVHKDKTTQTAFIMREEMEKGGDYLNETFNIGFDLPLRAEVTWGPSWGNQIEKL